MTTDQFGRQWNISLDELCPTCGQPDNCGDCNHRPLSDLQVQILAGLVTA